ncbi:Na+/H+ antiporter NhaA [Pseudomonas sp. NPDC007930]|uniref:Na+/H+ antiporter NhaA n=1 Tax=Pseudomonas sp. NPDC007930 TaxID=3364417 RepID=UPI0036E47690
MSLGHSLKRFFAMEAASGLLLISAAVLALVINNSPLAPWYQAFLDAPVQVRLGPLDIAKPALLWINDLLMAMFFLLIGLELKRELLQGQLAKFSQVALPGAAALGGMLVPALIYLAINHADPAARAGWAIPTATDIAFALGVLALLGNRVPPALKLFLMTLAVIDDLGAIAIIALFYSSDLAPAALGMAAACLVLLLALNRLGVRALGPYLLVGLVLWVCVLKSGVHATLAGVALAFFIPLKGERPPLVVLEHALHPWVAYIIVPLFAFANAGISLAGLSLQSFTHGVPLGIISGLLVGKTVGVFGLTWLAVRLRWASLPAGSNWGQVLGVAVLCGIGFTISIFVGSLAFEAGSSPYAGEDRLGILSGSCLAALLGYTLVRANLKR